mmetsp:Transcript_90955/g.256918  ORF Transcript_90955/g.256918 Transcript_90955/m.256918 type:complete len:240 (-) Transcript_90955:1277-1996(-)
MRRLHLNLRPCFAALLRNLLNHLLHSNLELGNSSFVCVRSGSRLVQLASNACQLVAEATRLVPERVRIRERGAQLNAQTNDSSPKLLSNLHLVRQLGDSVLACVCTGRRFAGLFPSARELVSEAGRLFPERLRITDGGGELLAYALDLAMEISRERFAPLCPGRGLASLIVGALRRLYVALQSNDSCCTIVCPNHGISCFLLGIDKLLSEALHLGPERRCVSDSDSELRSHALDLALEL